MSDFWKSYDITAAEFGPGYECYPLFGTVHLVELAVSALFILGMAVSSAWRCGTAGPGHARGGTSSWA